VFCLMLGRILAFFWERVIISKLKQRSADAVIKPEPPDYYKILHINDECRSLRENLVLLCYGLNVYF